MSYNKGVFDPCLEKLPCELEYEALHKNDPPRTSECPYDCRPHFVCLHFGCNALRDQRTGKWLHWVQCFIDEGTWVPPVVDVHIDNVVGRRKREHALAVLPTAPAATRAADTTTAATNTTRNYDSPSSGVRADDFGSIFSSSDHNRSAKRGKTENEQAYSENEEEEEEEEVEENEEKGDKEEQQEENVPRPASAVRFELDRKQKQKEMEKERLETAGRRRHDREGPGGWSEKERQTQKKQPQKQSVLPFTKAKDVDKERARARARVLGTGGNEKCVVWSDDDDFEVDDGWLTNQKKRSSGAGSLRQATLHHSLKPAKHSKQPSTKKSLHYNTINKHDGNINGRGADQATPLSESDSSSPDQNLDVRQSIHIQRSTSPSISTSKQQSSTWPKPKPFQGSPSKSPGGKGDH